jgi:hypothetical protein
VDGTTGRLSGSAVRNFANRVRVWGDNGRAARGSGFLRALGEASGTVLIHFTHGRVNDRCYCPAPASVPFAKCSFLKIAFPSVDDAGCNPFRHAYHDTSYRLPSLVRFRSVICVPAHARNVLVSMNDGEQTQRWRRPPNG